MMYVRQVINILFQNNKSQPQINNDTPQIDIDVHSINKTSNQQKCTSDQPYLPQNQHWCMPDQQNAHQVNKDMP